MEPPRAFPWDGGTVDVATPEYPDPRPRNAGGAAMTTALPLLEVEDLVIHYPIHSGVLLRRTGEVKAVDGVSFAIDEGETLGLVGESGCGKTTVAKGILRLVEVTSGSIDFRRRSGESVDLVTLDRRAMRPIRAEIQMIYQDPYSSLNPRWPVGEIVAEPLTVHRPDLSAAERAERVAWLLDEGRASPPIRRSAIHTSSRAASASASASRALSPPSRDWWSPTSRCRRSTSRSRRR